MKIIKRYANRRMYDSETSRTVTLDEVAEFIRSGDEIKVIDNSSGEDITSRVLGQTFLKLHEANDSRGDEPLTKYMLTALIRESDKGILEVVKKLLFAGIGFTKMSRSEMENLLRAVMAGNPAEQSDKPASENSISIDNLADRGQKEADRIFDGIVNTFQDVAQGFKENIVGAMEQFDQSKKIGELFQKIEQLSKGKAASAEETKNETVASTESNKP
ncbi:MAG: polyhydroxyalkanoate synthesis regulator DNA-binding domain-containing protein [Leptospiraceae bacterium]|nr:polyhydroxyalkanoate synthesis regulator DNA-binding domain-containing protein [Leptospiraceae bacterium]MCB1199860.1 polyhydroxyalkanoate synthesis regulator DNA-binding domain-containing protein [Leptospiraceae bacterium]